jgi:hypothetical protein
MSKSINTNTQDGGREAPPIVSTSVPTDKSTEPKNNKNEPARGYIYDLKENVSTKMAGLVNRLVTKQIENRMLRCLPSKVKEDVQTKIEGTIQNMVTDISSKSFDTGLNIIKAAPGVGNAVSVLSAADNVLAGIKNTKNSVFQIKEQIDKIQSQFNTGLASATNIPMPMPMPPKLPSSTELGLNNLPPQSGGGSIISNNLQTIINRAHHSVAQHHADVHHLIAHRDKIKKYNRGKKKHMQTGGGQIVTNNLDTIMDRAHHSVSQYHADVHHLIEHRNKIHEFRNTKTTIKHSTRPRGSQQHNAVLKRTTNSIRDFHNTTKRLRRG